MDERSGVDRRSNESNLDHSAISPRGHSSSCPYDRLYSMKVPYDRRKGTARRSQPAGGLGRVQGMMGFVFRLIPRASFSFDMSTDERATILEHVEYWSALTEQGRVLAFGPVGDAHGAYGIGIVLAESQTDAEALRDDDPAIKSPHGFATEIAPMLRLVTPNQTYDAAPG